MPQSDEELVRDTWERIDWISDEYGDGTTLIVGYRQFGVKNEVGNGKLYLSPSDMDQIWSAAATFTREHKRKIAEREIDIDFMLGFSAYEAHGVYGHSRERILAMLTESLAQMKVGMKETV